MDPATNKEAEINSVLSAQPINIYRLMCLGKTKGGFVSNALRRRVWPLILGIDPPLTPTTKTETTNLTGGYYLPLQNLLLEMKKDYAVITGDVERSFLCINGYSEVDKKLLRENLETLLKKLLARNPSLRYYQGLHDIAGGFLLVLPPSLALLATETVCRYYIKDFVLSTFDEGVIPLLRSLYTLLSHADSKLSNIITKACSKEVPAFAIAWVLTWFVHEMSSPEQITRAFDYFLCSHPIAPLYTAAAVVLNKSDLIKETKAKGNFGMAELYWVFQRIEWSKEEFEDLLQNTTKLMEKVPTDAVISELYYKLPPESPVARYRNRIEHIYKNHKTIMYKVEQKQQKYSAVTLLVMPFLLVAAYSIGALLELTHFKF